MRSLGAFDLTEESIIWSKIYPSMLDKDRSAVWLAELAKSSIVEIRFGDERQEFKLMLRGFYKSRRSHSQLQER